MFKFFDFNQISASSIAAVLREALAIAEKYPYEYARINAEGNLGFSSELLDTELRAIDEELESFVWTHLNRKKVFHAAVDATMQKNGTDDSGEPLPIVEKLAGWRYAQDMLFDYDATGRRHDNFRDWLVDELDSMQDEFDKLSRRIGRQG